MYKPAARVKGCSTWAVYHIHCEVVHENGAVSHLNKQGEHTNGRKVSL